MKNRLLPLAIFGVGGLGVLLLSDYGREAVRRLAGAFEDAPRRFLEWNELAQRELDSIQAALNQVAENLEAV
jgi:hypothetical protein